MIVLAGGEFEYCRDVFWFEVGVVGQDLVARRAGGQEVEHILHTNAKATNARAAAANVGSHRDSVYRAHRINPCGIRLLRVTGLSSFTLEFHVDS